MAFTLYNAPQSTCSQRVRFVLNAKKLPFAEIKLDLLAGDQLKPDYLKLNPNGVVPTLVHDGKPIIESSLTLAFLASPILWSPEMLNQASTIMRLNPVTHLFAIWREPLSTGHIAMGSMIYVLACLAVLAVASLVTVTHLRKAAFWI